MYEETFHLSEPPFQLRPDPRYYFGSSGHDRAMSYLTFGLSQGEGFVVVTGEVGTGKTTLIGYLMSSLDTEKYAAATIVTTQVSGDDLLRLIAAGFGIDTDVDKAKLLTRLHQHFQRLAAQGRRPLIIVDEAQNLSVAAIEELRMLSNLDIGADMSLQTLIIGQPQFREHLAREDLAQLRQRVVAMYHLGPLSREETQAYILHRLTCAGWPGQPVIEDQVFNTVFASTGGVPRLINLMFGRIMLSTHLDSAETVTAAAAEQVAQDLSVEFGTARPAKAKRGTSKVS